MGKVKQILGKEACISDDEYLRCPDVFFTFSYVVLLDTSENKRILAAIDEVEEFVAASFEEDEK